MKATALEDVGIIGSGEHFIVPEGTVFYAYPLQVTADRCSRQYLQVKGGLYNRLVFSRFSRSFRIEEGDPPEPDIWGIMADLYQDMEAK